MTFKRESRRNGKMIKNLAWTILLLLALLIFPQRIEAQDTLVNYAGNSVGLVTGSTTFAFFQSGFPASNFYYYFNVTPQTAVTFYITNAGSGTDAITIKTIFTGNPSSPAPTVDSSQWAAFTTYVVQTGNGGATGAAGSQLT